jgi:hypothetical protein
MSDEHSAPWRESPLRLTIVTATTDPDRAHDCLASWMATAVTQPRLQTVVNSYLGTVPAFRLGVERALQEDPPADIIACLHDDLEITEQGWDDKVLEHFRRHPHCGLLGFGGAIALGDADLYQKPYNPMSLARQGFRSNMRDAELHGIRSLLAERVACLDGFSQIGRREFWLGQGLRPNLDNAHDPDRYGGLRQWEAPLEAIEDHGIIHHFYDGALGALAERMGWEVWYLPVACHHFGGRTAVGDSGYQAWAAKQIPGGDQGYWEQSHRHAYDWLRDVLPIRI